MAAKPVWTSSSFLVYTGGLTVLGAARRCARLPPRATTASGARPAGRCSSSSSSPSIANALRLRRDRWIAARASSRFASVIAWAASSARSWCVVRLARQLELGSFGHWSRRAPLARVARSSSPRGDDHAALPLPVHPAHLGRRRLVLRHRPHLDRRQLDGGRDARRSASPISLAGSVSRQAVGVLAPPRRRPADRRRAPLTGGTRATCDWALISASSPSSSSGSRT